MSRVRVYLSGDDTHDRVLQAFYDGCPQEKQFSHVFNYAPSDVAVVFGVGKRAVPVSQHRAAIIAQQTANRCRTVILETGYIKRGDGPDDYYAAGFDGLNNRADFRNQNSPEDRAKALHVEFKAWRHHEQDKHILLCAQVPWDASVENIYLERWLSDTLADIRSVTGREVRFRPHPKAGFLRLMDLPLSVGPVDWRKVHAVVTFNSNIAVEAAIEGIPVFVDDIGSMALPIANRSLQDLEHPRMPERWQWLCDLAYAQWTCDELRQGLAWRHLFR